MNKPKPPEVIHDLFAKAVEKEVVRETRRLNKRITTLERQATQLRATLLEYRNHMSRYQKELREFRSMMRRGELV
jgi:hypothetical protein